MSFVGQSQCWILRRVLLIIPAAAGALQCPAAAQDFVPRQPATESVSQSTQSPVFTDYAATTASYSLSGSGAYSPGQSGGPTDEDLARRVAELEKALQQLRSQSQAQQKTPPQRMSLSVRGHFLFDAAVFSQDAADIQRFDEQNGLDVRVARLFVEGSGLEVMSYRAEFDYVRRVLGDLWIGVSELPLVSNLRVGYLKEPFSMEQIASRKYNTFLERSLAEAIHIPPRRLGIMAFDNTEDQRRTWAIGLFADDPGITFVQDDTFGGAVTMRTTWLAWYDEATQGRGLLHTGISYSHRECFRHTVRYQVRPESFLASFAIDTGNIPAETVDLLGTELAFVYGPFSAQSEYLVGIINRIGASDAVIQGTYVILSYFLTGESRSYQRDRGIFGQIRPYENFFRVRTQDGSIQTGKGAWEVRYRYSYLDALDGGKLASGGRIGNHGVGVNWYLNPFTKLMIEYIYSAIDRPDQPSTGHLHIFQMRTQIEF